MEKSIILETQQNCIVKPQASQSFEKVQIKLQNSKLELNIVFFMFNIILIVSIPFITIFQLFSDTKYLDIKCYLTQGLVCLSVLVTLINVIKLKVTFLDFLKSVFILDSITLSTIIATIAFIGLMKFLDRNKWQMKVIQVGFAIFIVFYGSNLRLLLLHMKWKTWKVIVYKISLYIMALLFFSAGIYCFYTNYSFTFNLLKAFDRLVKHFVTLFIFAVFQFSCKLIKTMSNFDYTQKFKYDYRIKNQHRLTRPIRTNINNVKKQYIKSQRLIQASRRQIGLEKPGNEAKKQKIVEFIPVTKLT